METEFFVNQEVVDIISGKEGRVTSTQAYAINSIAVLFPDDIVRYYTKDGMLYRDNIVRQLYPAGTTATIQVHTQEDQQSLFQVDDVVYDLRFGQGKVASTGSAENEYPVRVYFNSGKRVNYCHDGKDSKDHLESILKLVERKEKCKFHVGDAVISLLSGPGTVTEIGEHSVSVSFEAYTETYDKEGIYLPYQYPTLFLASENPTLKQIIGSTDDNIRNG